MKVRLAIELLSGGARVVALESRRKEGHALVGYATVRDAEGPEELAEQLMQAASTADVKMEEAVLTLPLSLGAVYQTFELPVLKPEELRAVAERELEREIGEEARELEIRTWQYGEEAAGSPNTLVVGMPEDIVEIGHRFTDAVDIPVVHMSTTPTALYHGLWTAGELAEDSVTSLVYAGDESGFALYAHGKEWILLHPFPVPYEDELTEPGEKASALVREVRQSFMYLRRRVPGAPLETCILAGPGLPAEDLTTRLQDVLPGAEVRNFTFPGRLELEGLASTGDFLDRQAAYAVPLLLSADPQRLPIDYLPLQARLPRVRERMVRDLVTAGTAGVLLVAGGWWLADDQLSRARDRQVTARAQLKEVEPQFARLQAARRLQGWINAAEQFRDLSGQQLVLGADLLPELSVAVTEAVTLDSLRWSLGASGLQVEMTGRAEAGSSGDVQTAFGEFLAGLRNSPLFLAPTAEQRTEQGPTGDYVLRFTVRSPLMGQAPPSEASPAGDGGETGGGGSGGGG